MARTNKFLGPLIGRLQGHPTDRFGKLSVRKTLSNPLRFLKGIFTSNFRDIGNLRPSVFGLIKMSFRVPKKGQLRFSERKHVRPTVFEKWTKIP